MISAVWKEKVQGTTISMQFSCHKIELHTNTIGTRGNTHLYSKGKRKPVVSPSTRIAVSDEDFNICHMQVTSTYSICAIQ